MMSLQTSEEILSDSKQLSKKRKWDDIPADGVSEKPEKIKSMKPIPDYDVSQNQTPFPLEWQQCLDIKSGQMFLYNTRTNKRTSTGPKLNVQPYNPAPMSLDLELNPPCQSHQVTDINRKHGFSTTSICQKDHVMISSTITRSPSWLTFEGDQQEMVTAVCKKCYMLVMMCKSTPACPNCKFMHSSDQEVEG
ncbi:hypothetical protein Salat_0582500 [Sesamum alatum]|uniref:WW domain-containing protein n=1 Tax=Sesamum alatum TaxID=300844 RepID=A0AAE1YQQ9_9LAMI|nr:hypothetical protein Salat_0582500 [Sesamum alatum]